MSKKEIKEREEEKMGQRRKNKLLINTKETKISRKIYHVHGLEDSVLLNKILFKGIYIVKTTPFKIYACFLVEIDHLFLNIM